MIQAPINWGGPDDWPPTLSLSTDSSPPDSPVSAAQPDEGRPAAPDGGAEASPPDRQPEEEPSPVPGETAPAAGETSPEEALAPISVDEQGIVVPPPPDIPSLLREMRNAMQTARYADVLPVLQILKEASLSPEEREEVLYNEMTAIYETRLNQLAEYGPAIIQAANAAMNANHSSSRVPEAMSMLVLANLAMDNMEDATGYARLLGRQYPGNPAVPVAFLALGQKQMEHRQYAEATSSFQTIIQDYPENRAAQTAARLQTYALYRQGHMERASTLLDFVDRRWPRMYLDDPEFLAMAADIQVHQGRLEGALRTYWIQYNLNPTLAEAPSTLARISELYFLLGDPLTAGKVLEELLRAFPASPVAPRALLRLGENGIHDGNPDLDELFALFQAPNPRIPGIYYQRILRDYPSSPEAMTAQLRSLAWQLWNNEYMPAMEGARSFMIDYENKPEFLRAQDILLRGFARELGTALAEENFERVLSLWERFPQAQNFYQPLEPDLRMALARGLLNRGEEEQALSMLETFLEGPGDSDYSLYAYNLFLASYLRNQKWNELLTLGEKVANWNLPGEARAQMDYVLALSAQNLGLTGRALPLWRGLAPREDIPLYYRAYATYYLARDAELRQDLRDAYQYNLDTLGMFTQLRDDQSPYADPERIRESIAALMDVTEIAGRFAEALEWAARYAEFVPLDSPDYGGLRFREARLHRKLGDMARWRAILQGIVDNEPDSVFGRMAASELHTEDVARNLSRFSGP
jgi:TolA-binding protein